MPPLTLATALTSWTVDVAALACIVPAGLAYFRAAGRSGGPARCFGAGLVLWLLTVSGAVAVYAPVLFWVRALQVLLLLFVVPFLLALGRPVTVLRERLGPAGQARIDRALASRASRVLLSPLTTSVAMLATPWLLYLTPWYLASMHGPLAAATRILLVLIGFGYFYARLQTDPVPRRFSPLLSIGISVAESLADGILGVVLWLGPLIGYHYYTALGRTWGPSLRLDQTIGAGILWILGDVLGIPFVLVLMRALAGHERVAARQADQRADAPSSGLWWESDPELRQRFRRY